MATENDNFKRIEEILYTYKYKSLLAFARDADILYQTLLDIKKGRINISTRIADKIIKLHPEISYHWIIAGAGNMFNNHINGNNNTNHAEHIINSHDITITKHDKDFCDSQLYKDMFNTLTTISLQIKDLSDQIKVKDEHILYCRQHIDRLIGIIEKK